MKDHMNFNTEAMKRIKFMDEELYYWMEDMNDCSQSDENKKDRDHVTAGIIFGATAILIFAGAAGFLGELIFFLIIGLMILIVS